MKFTAPISIKEDSDLASVIRFAKNAIQTLSLIVTKQITFSDNVRCSIVQNLAITTTEIAIPHTLGTVPSGYLVSKNSSYFNVRTGSSAWTAQNIYLVAEGSATIDLIILGG